MPRHGRNKGPSDRTIVHYKGMVNRPFNRPFNIPDDHLKNLRTDEPTSPSVPEDITVSTLTVSGAATLASGLDINGASIINVGDPVDPTDVPNKAYVDEKVSHCPLRSVSVRSGETIAIDSEEMGIILGGNSDYVKSLTINFPQDPADGQCFVILGSVNVGTFNTDAKFARGNAVKRIEAGVPLRYLWHSDTKRWYKW